MPIYLARNAYEKILGAHIYKIVDARLWMQDCDSGVRHVIGTPKRLI
ncbi:MAG: hypothetical protein ABJB16_18770 [Saprospiraceae bacterium]